MPTCWTGSPTFFEQQLLKPLSSYALDQLRRRMINSATSTRDPVKSARAIVQMAFDTEVGAAVGKILVIDEEVFSTTVCERRRYLDIDADIQNFSFLVDPALAALNALHVLPDGYVRLLSVHAHSPYARYRMAALCATLCVATVLAEAPAASSLEFSFEESVSIAEVTDVE